MMNTYDWWVAKLRAIRHSKPPEPPMRVRLHEAGHAVAGHRFGYVQQGIMLREDDTGETSQQYATGMDDDMSVRLQTEIIISMTGFAVTLEYPEYKTDALRIGGDVQAELVNAAIIHRIDPGLGSADEIMDTLWVRARLVDKLSYKAEWYGRAFVQVDRFYPSSKLCHDCGHKYKGLRLSEREWVCERCGIPHDRDVNAALNIRDEALRLSQEQA